MKRCQLSSISFTAALVWLVVHAPAAAQLPSFNEVPLLGYFATYNDRNVEFGINVNSGVRLMPNLSGQLSATFTVGTYALDITPRLIAMNPDGTTTNRRITPESLEADTPVTDKFEKTTIRGQVTGGGSFEFTLEQNRGVLIMGGRMLNPEEVNPPHRFAIEIKVPAQLTSGNLNTLSKLTAAEPDDSRARREHREFMRQFRSDRIALRWIDQQSGRFQLTETFDDDATAINGPGIAELELQSHIYRARRLVINAENGSAITLTPTREGMLQPGFTLLWMNDPEKDPDAKARVAIAVR